MHIIDTDQKDSYFTKLGWKRHSSNIHKKMLNGHKISSWASSCVMYAKAAVYFNYKFAQVHALLILLESVLVQLP